jgi:hypothetical protein
MMMEAVRNPETSVYSETTRRYTPEDSKLHIIQSFVESLQASECSVCIDILFSSNVAEDWNSGRHAEEGPRHYYPSDLLPHLVRHVLHIYLQLRAEINS